MTYDPGSADLDEPVDAGDQSDQRGQGDQGESAEPAERVRTGVGRVDEVIRSVEELEERPIEEHVGVFEAAHGQLRYALDHPEDAGDESGAGSGDGSGDQSDDGSDSGADALDAGSAEE